MNRWTDEELSKLFLCGTASESLPAEALLQTRKAVRTALAEVKNYGLIVRTLKTVKGMLQRIFQRIFGVLVNEDRVDNDVLDVPSPFIPYARIFAVDGSAEVLRNNIKSNVRASKFSAVHAGDQLTATKGSLDVKFFAGQRTTLASGTQAVLSKFSSGEHFKTVEVILNIGRAVTNITTPLATGDTFLIGSPLATAHVRGTEWISEARVEGDSFFATLRGKIAVKVGDAMVDLPAGQSLRVVPGQALVPEVFEVPPEAGKSRPKLPRSVPKSVRIYFSDAGDTLLSISSRFDCSLADLTRANPGLSIAGVMKAGLMIMIPVKLIS